MSKTMLAVALAASFGLALPLGAAADAELGHEAERGSQGAQPGTHQDQSSAKGAGLAEAWAALVAARDAIARDVESGTLGEIHAKAEPLPKLAEALLAQSGDLEPGKRARVEGAAKQVARVADALHVAADRGDAAGTRKELSRLDGLLQLIDAQYPAGALDAGGHRGEAHSARPAHGHSAHAHTEGPAGVVDVAPQASVRVEVSDELRFEPQRIEVQAGIPTRIELVNAGAAEHSLSAGSGVQPTAGSSD